MTPYLDHNATSPMRRSARRALWMGMRNATGNPSSIHRDGMRSRALLDESRQRIASLLEVSADQLVFTSGGSESNNLAIRGVWSRRDRTRRRVVTSSIEHPSVLETIRALEHEGAIVDVVDPTSDGILDVDEVARRVGGDTALVSIQLANHETGALQPIAEIARRVHAKGGLLHVDAVQAFGKIAVQPAALDADFVTITAHKVGGPIGIGALVIRSRMQTPSPILFGGSQEHGWRAGTQPAFLATSFAAAATEAIERLHTTADQHRELRVQLIEQLRSIVPKAMGGRQASSSTAQSLRSNDDLSSDSVHFHTRLDRSVPNTLSFSIPGIDREALLVNLDLLGVRISAGAACSSGSLGPSPVLLAMGLSEEEASCALRISFGHDSIRDHVETFGKALEKSLQRSCQKREVF